MSTKQKILFWVFSTLFLIITAFFFEVGLDIGQDDTKDAPSTPAPAPTESSGPSPYSL